MTLRIIVAICWITSFFWALETVYQIWYLFIIKTTDKKLGVEISWVFILKKKFKAVFYLLYINSKKLSLQVTAIFYLSRTINNDHCAQPSWHSASDVFARDSGHTCACKSLPRIPARLFSSFSCASTRKIPETLIRHHDYFRNHIWRPPCSISRYLISLQTMKIFRSKGKNLKLKIFDISTEGCW